MFQVTSRISLDRLNKQPTEKLTLNIRANVRDDGLDRCSVRMTWRTLKLGSDGGDSGSYKCKRGYGGVNGEVWRSLHLAGV
jgi:hypothetical protein